MVKLIRSIKSSVGILNSPKRSKSTTIIIMHMPRFFRHFRVDNRLQGGEIVLLVEVLQQPSVVWWWGLEPGTARMGQVKSGPVVQFQSAVWQGFFTGNL